MSDFALTRIESHWQETVFVSILEQYKESHNWQACLKAVIDKFQHIEDAIIELSTILNLGGELTGGHLDWLASLVNITRMPGESDGEFLNRVIQLGSTATPDGVISAVATLSKSEKINVHYLEDADCTFLVYTPEGKQLTRQSVNSLAGAGILGLPAAAIALADGSLLTTCDDSKRILAVANDGDIEDMDYMDVRALVFAKEGV